MVIVVVDYGIEIHGCTIWVIGFVGWMIDWVSRGLGRGSSRVGNGFGLVKM
jgi:hypothetical protein